MVDYTATANMAQRLITKYGRSVTVSKISQTPENNLKPWRGDSTPRDDSSVIQRVVLDSVFVDPVSLRTFGFSTEDDELLKRSHQIALIAAKDTNGALLEEYDEVLDNSTIWKISRVVKLQPGPTVLLYILGLMR